jgi:hypothetical protein
VTIKNRLTILVVFILVLGFGADLSAQAQPAQQWAADQQVPGYLDDTFTPILIADRNRTAHAFVSQWINDGEDRRQAIVYRKWSLAGGWTRPVDVILAPLGGDAVLLGAHLDDLGIVHVAFENGEGRNAVMYYTYAPADSADIVSAWSAPIVIGTGVAGVNSAAFSGDGNLNLVIIYSGNSDGNGVYAVTSADQGKTWSEEPQLVFSPPDSELIPYSLRLVNRNATQMSAAWNLVSSLGVDEALYFTSYDLSTNTWAKATELEKRVDLPDYFGPSFPSITDNGRDTVIMYNGGNPFTGQPVNVGRPVQRATFSTDGGRTWATSINPFPFHVGRSGEHTLVLDGNGRTHALFVQRIETLVDGAYSIIGGVWHSVYEGGSWTNPGRFVTTYSPHDVRAVVVQGNILLVVWREDPGEGQHGIWYTYLALDNPELPITPLPTADALSPGSSAIGTQLPDDTQPGIFSTPTPMQLTDSQRNILDGNPNPGMPLAVAMIPVLVVLVGVVLAYRFLRTRA